MKALLTDVQLFTMVLLTAILIYSILDSTFSKERRIFREVAQPFALFAMGIVIGMYLPEREPIFGIVIVVSVACIFLLPKVIKAVTNLSRRAVAPKS